MRNALLAAVLVALGAQAFTALAEDPPVPDRAEPDPARPDPARPAPAKPDAAIPDPAGPDSSPEDATEPGEIPLTAHSDQPLALRRAPRLEPLPPGVVSSELPVFLRADRIDGYFNATITARGHAELRQRPVSILSEELAYSVPDERCVADGNVEIRRGLDTVTGPHAAYNLKSQSGNIDDALLDFAAGPGRLRAAHAAAQTAVLVDAEHDHLEQAEYTTCRADQQDWFLTGNVIDIDRTLQEGVAHDARIVFGGVPILYSPYMSFPLNDQRKSGFLAPTIGTTGTNGVDVSLPYYFNLAPNYDDTLTPRVMSKRGVLIADEFRYLQPDYHGIFEGELLDHDQSAGFRRYLLGLTHDQNLPAGLRLHVSAAEVSDGNYFRDLSTTVNATSTTYLPRDFLLSWGGGAGWTLGARALSYQTIQDPKFDVVNQYRELPQLTANYSRRIDLFRVSWQNEFVEFRHPSLVDGARYVSYPSVSLPLINDWGYVTPKLGYHYTAYDLGFDPAQAAIAATSTTAAIAAQPGLGPQHLTRGLPIGSIDSGLFFERNIELQGHELLQTLEPRLYYLNIPDRIQSNLPVFNTVVADFNYSQLFAENEYTGPDRINQANQLTAAVQSRLIDPTTGIETVRAVLGQRFYFAEQGVTLPGEIPRSANYSDIIAGISGRVLEHSTAEVSSDYNPALRRTEKLVLAWHYRPEPGETLNLAYRINRDTPGQPDIRQIDASAEWPVLGHWSTVMRVNYDTAQSYLVEAVAGAEYTAQCWVFRVVAHRLAVSAVQSSTSLFFQLELNGLAKLGTNPLDVLRLNIPGYSKTNEIPQ